MKTINKAYKDIFAKTEDQKSVEDNRMSNLVFQAKWQPDALLQHLVALRENATSDESFFKESSIPWAEVCTTLVAYQYKSFFEVAEILKSLKNLSNQSKRNAWFSLSHAHMFLEEGNLYLYLPKLAKILLHFGNKQDTLQRLLKGESDGLTALEAVVRCKNGLEKIKVLMQVFSILGASDKAIILALAPPYSRFPTPLSVLINNFPKESHEFIEFLQREKGLSSAAAIKAYLKPRHIPNLFKFAEPDIALIKIKNASAAGNLTFLLLFNIAVQQNCLRKTSLDKVYIELKNYACRYDNANLYELACAKLHKKLGEMEDLATIASYASVNILRLLLERKVDLNVITNDDNNTLLMRCCEGLMHVGFPDQQAADNRRLAAVKLLVTQGKININAKDYGSTALSASVYAQSLAIVNYLLSKGAIATNVQFVCTDLTIIKLLMQRNACFRHGEYVRTLLVNDSLGTRLIKPLELIINQYLQGSKIPTPTANIDTKGYKFSL